MPDWSNWHRESDDDKPQGPSLPRDESGHTIIPTEQGIREALQKVTDAKERARIAQLRERCLDQR